MQLQEPFRFDIKPIRDDRDHADALRTIEALWDAEPGSPEFDHMDVLATLVEAYEARRWPIVELDPIAAIEAAMVADGHSRAELAALIGQNRATEVMARKRPLTLNMIRAISAAWHVPTEVLVREYALAE